MNESERAQHRRATLRDYRQSGLTQKAFCRSRGVAFSTLGCWLKQERVSSESHQAFIEVGMPRELDPLSGAGVFLFCNRECPILKALYWNANGLCEWQEVKAGAAFVQAAP